MYHLMVAWEVALAEYLFPYCGEWNFWCVSGIEVLAPAAVFYLLILVWEIFE